MPAIDDESKAHGTVATLSSVATPDAAVDSRRTKVSIVDGLVTEEVETVLNAISTVLQGLAAFFATAAVAGTGHAGTDGQGRQVNGTSS